MRILIEVFAALVFGAIVLAVIGLDSNSPTGTSQPKSAQRTLGELRCENRGAIVIKVDGRDYAVNGMASPRYPPIQALWNENSQPKIDVDRLIAQGITLCAW